MVLIKKKIEALTSISFAKKKKKEVEEISHSCCVYASQKPKGN
jgi:hypothetical protein